MNKETVTGIIGALVLVAAMGGIFFYERSQLQEYTLGWVATEPTESARQGTLQHGAHHQHTFTGNVTTGLVAGVEVVLSWALHPGDGFGLLVTRPDGASVAQDQPGGTIRLGVPVQEAPENETVVERSAEGALKQGWGRLNETARSAGQGTWAVTVTLTNAMRANAVPVLDAEPGENSYTLAFHVLTWEPELRLRQR